MTRYGRKPKVTVEELAVDREDVGTDPFNRAQR